MTVVELDEAEWTNTWPGDWNLYDGKTNIATVEIVRIGQVTWRWLARAAPNARWHSAKTADEAKVAAKAELREWFLLREKTDAEGA